LLHEYVAILLTLIKANEFVKWIPPYFELRIAHFKLKGFQYQNSKRKLATNSIEPSQAALKWQRLITFAFCK
jgi:hypothetical protein